MFREIINFSIQYRKISSSKSNSQKIVPVAEAKRFILDCLRAVKVPKDNAVIMANMLVAADHRRIYSHGMNRLEHYLNDLKNKLTDGGAIPKILCESSATAWVDGCNGLGSVVATFSMNTAIKKAKTEGVGWVCAKYSNHFGFGAYYAEMAKKAGLVGIVMTNTSPLLVPTGAKKVALGTNPISMAAGVSDCDFFSLDIATTAVSMGKIEIHKRKGAPLVAGWALDEDGNVTTDPVLASKARALLPLGGVALTSGYKGYGLAALVDILSGVMSGANYSTNIRSWTPGGSTEPANIGHLFVAVNPRAFDPDFEKRLINFNCILRNLEPVDKKFPVVIPGDMERRNIEQTDKEGGITYVEDQLKTCEKLANSLKIKPLSFK